MYLPGLSGSLPPELGQLERLTNLQIVNTTLSGGWGALQAQNSLTSLVCGWVHPPTRGSAGGGGGGGVRPGEEEWGAGGGCGGRGRACSGVGRGRGRQHAACSH